MKEEAKVSYSSKREAEVFEFGKDYKTKLAFINPKVVEKAVNCSDA